MFDWTSAMPASAACTVQSTNGRILSMSGEEPHELALGDGDTFPSAAVRRTYPTSRALLFAISGLIAVVWTGAHYGGAIRGWLRSRTGRQ
jgi:hypothetical protein